MVPEFRLDAERRTTRPHIRRIPNYVGTPFEIGITLGVMSTYLSSGLEKLTGGLISGLLAWLLCFAAVLVVFITVSVILPLLWALAPAAKAKYDAAPSLFKHFR